MTPDQRVEFERRLIEKAFEAGIMGMDGLTIEPLSVGAPGEEPSYEDFESARDSLIDRGIFRTESTMPGDWIALSFDEWGRRIAAKIGPSNVERSWASSDIASMLRGKGES